MLAYLFYHGLSTWIQIRNSDSATGFESIQIRRILDLFNPGIENYFVSKFSASRILDSKIYRNCSNFEKVMT